MTEVGTVIAQNNNQVTLSYERHEGCKNCGSNFCNIESRQIVAINSKHLPLNQGDKVKIYVETGRTVFSSFLLLILPLILFIAGYLLSDNVLPNAGEFIRIGAGAAGLAVGFIGAYFYSRSRKEKDFPQIVEKVAATAESEIN